jgi:hypothetical protein
MDEDKIIQKLQEHDKRFDEHDKRFDLVIGKLSEHDERLDNLVTKVEFQDFKDKVLTGQDKMMNILERLDQERIFTTAWVGRIEKEVEEHTREIKNIKQALKIQ